MRLQELRPRAAQLAGVGQQLVASLLECLVPLGTLTGLHPEFVFNRHHRTRSNQLLQQLRQFLAKVVTADVQVRHEQIGERVRVGPNPRVQRLTLMRQLADQKDQRTNLVSQFVIRFVLLASNRL